MFINQLRCGNAINAQSQSISVSIVDLCVCVCCAAFCACKLQSDFRVLYARQPSTDTKKVQSVRNFYQRLLLFSRTICAVFTDAVRSNDNNSRHRHAKSMTCLWLMPAISAMSHNSCRFSHNDLFTCIFCIQCFS